MDACGKLVAQASFIQVGWAVTHNYSWRRKASTAAHVAGAVWLGNECVWRSDLVDTCRWERPHEALNMKCPAELYLVFPRRYDGLPELIYPFHHRELLVTACATPYASRNRFDVDAIN